MSPATECCGLGRPARQPPGYQRSLCESGTASPPPRRAPPPGLAAIRLLLPLSAAARPSTHPAALVRAARPARTGRRARSPRAIPARRRTRAARAARAPAARTRAAAPPPGSAGPRASRACAPRTAPSAAARAGRRLGGRACARGVHAVWGGEGWVAERARGLLHAPRMHRACRGGQDEALTPSRPVCQARAAAWDSKACRTRRVLSSPADACPCRHARQTGRPTRTAKSWLAGGAGSPSAGGAPRPSARLSASEAGSSRRTSQATSLLAIGRRIQSPLYATSRQVPLRRPYAAPGVSGRLETLLPSSRQVPLRRPCAAPGVPGRSGPCHPRRPCCPRRAAPRRCL